MTVDRLKRLELPNQDFQLDACLEIILEIERRIDVPTLVVNNVRIWPLVRLELWHNLTRISKLDRTLASKILNSVADLKSRLMTPECTLNRSPGLNRLMNWMTPSEQQTALFLTRGSHTIKHQNFEIDRVFGMLPDMLAKDYGQRVLALVVDNKPSALCGFPVSLFEHDCRVSQLPFRKSVKDILELVNRQLEAPIVFGHYIARYFCFVPYWQALFSKIKPSLVFLECYYESPLMALVSVARKNGATVVDVAHGKQGKNHAMYCHWGKLPDEGYDQLPDYFWVWGEESADNINRTKDSESHAAVPVGNLLALFYDQIPQSGELINLSRDTKTTKILVSLQHDASLPDFVWQSIEKLKNCYWIIRAHPVTPAAKMEQLGNQIGECGKFEMMDLDLAKELPLYSLLKTVDLHVTRWSSVCYEALTFKVPTIFVDAIADSIYSDYIAKKHFFNADNANNFCQHVLEQCPGFESQEDTPYLNLNQAVLLNQLSELGLQPHGQ